MEKPSQQFVQKLEQSLRMQYRAQYAVKKSPFKFLKFFIPIFSGALIVTLVFMNFSNHPNNTSSPVQQSAVTQSTGSNGSQFEAFSGGAQEEQIMQDFDNDELNQIDNSVKLAAAGNFQ